ncbi:cation diffusion facilitator family transporter [Pseudomonas protegens]|jgi:cation diffusion facilitator family transporter|uniref:Cation efflux family protein n=1 Tax=Pseudomonas protegens (strain DSM 19095 / LMG 27888 / CFBP 6595 / CHA0) TaxID=1124983 RepID=A0A2C9EL18_PSEPH|nr:CDF family Co(II)/Ni(II) efflux transporter DmeF [Pseudomonas protegens]AGL84344.1 cation efflux family protein [Pseudomonas protegens CHA0]MBP5112516.1 CDF family Co(II)/Ni(II) efflux transporter DmeF [Pseudomonas protegens]QTU24213.1 CDF family Co(II)/Ni(II) efflux transporter DmeF [Pseudomonas protegens]QTU33744.1 CDF family Co(II)/Ni(II) efflux transporter DmeF [Pseudomonas protegens]RLO24259.1 cation transporter [Pseudomonas protegens]
MNLSQQAAHLAHDHRFLGADHDDNARRTLWVVLLTVVMMAGEIVAGYLTGSMALLADGLHMATHAGALGIAAAAYGFARRNAGNRRFSFGTGKVGDLAGFASAIILGLVALGIAGESLVRLFQPTRVAFGEATLIAVAGLLVNILSAWLLGGGHDHHGHSHGLSHDHEHHEHHEHHQSHRAGGDNNLRSAYVHVLADALTSVLAIAALLAGRYLGWVWLDPAMGIVGALVIARWSYALIKSSAAVLLDASDEQVAGQIRASVEGPGDASIVDLHVWQVGPGARAAIVSVVARASLSAETVRARLAALPGLSHLTLELRSV